MALKVMYPGIGQSLLATLVCTEYDGVWRLDRALDGPGGSRLGTGARAGRCQSRVLYFTEHGNRGRAMPDVWAGAVFAAAADGLEARIVCGCGSMLLRARWR